jgi:tetratricopeptide (TPR) repeat protein
MGSTVLAALGEPERGVEWAKRSLAIDPDEAIIQYNSACTYVMLGMFDEAIECLEAAVVESSMSRAWVENDPDLDPIRDDPRLHELLQRVDNLAVG